MLRAFLLYLSRAPWARRLVTRWRFARRAAARFVAGDTLEETLPVIRGLNEAGLYVTLDHLGENVTSRVEAEGATAAYLQMLQTLADQGVSASVSLKLTQLGLALDKSLALENLRRIVERAAQLGNFVRIDMEDSPWIDATLEIYNTLRDSGLDNVGVVIQSYLFRSEADTRTLLKRKARIRLVKGAYDEPPQIAYARKKDVDANFDRLTALILDAMAEHEHDIDVAQGQRPPILAVATHDEKRIDFAKEYAQRVGVSRGALEFQMLFGIRNELQRRLAAQGYPVRVYIPYGTEWYPYFMRRLAERPANLWFFLSNLLRR
jgi:proline dehydrogenase